MAALLLHPSARLLPPLPTSIASSSQLSIRRLRPITLLPLTRVHCCARQAPHPTAGAAGRESVAAAASWPDKLAGAVTWKAAASVTIVLAASFAFFAAPVNARTGVNKPELLPKEFTTVIDVAGFLSPGQENRLRQEIENLEKDTGYKLRVLAQNYPDTPGLAIKDFWQVDDRTIVFVADPTFGNIINFNVGSLVDLDVPRSFWSQVSGKFGNMFYWKEKGEDASIEAAVTAISRCLRDPTGTNNCSDVL